MQRLFLSVFIAAVFATAFALPVTAHAQNEGEKWEYATVHIMFNIGMPTASKYKKMLEKGDVKFMLLTTSTGVEDLEGFSLPKVFKKMSDEGWKMLDASQTQGIYYIYQFQRPLKN